jgi:GntR family transcriptional regulator, rspAB operon transcriptional repressor
MMKSGNSEAALPRIEQRRAVDEVYQLLREAIVTRQFAPGQRLRLNEIARQFGTSLTPVRGAIELLAAEGLVDVQPRSGTFVAMANAQYIEETLDVRCALECMAAEKAAPKLTDDDIAKARRLLKDLARPVRDERDGRKHDAANSELHQILIRASGNRRLAEMYEKLNAHLTIALLHARAAGWKRRLGQEQAEHEAIVDAMERRDEKVVVEVLRRHIVGAKESLMASIEETA